MVLARLVWLPALWAAWAPATLRADTWCSTHFPDAVVCEDFDRYCMSPPPDPQECPAGSTVSMNPFYVQWVPTGDITGYCASALDLRDDYASSPPFAGFTNTQEGGVFGYSIKSIPPEIRERFGPEYSTVIATDLNPLILEFILNGERFGRSAFDNSFLTLGLSSAFPPTDWVFSEWCSCMTPPLKRWPVICQQESPIAGCPPIAAAPSRSVLAIGFLAYLDNNPCHCSETNHWPYNHHLSFFDGHKWYRLRGGLFAGSGDFQLRNNEHKIRLTIRPASVKVELTTLDTGEYSWCEIPGAYAGPFNALGAGFPKACRLDPAQWVCFEDPTCDKPLGLPGGGENHYDNIVLRGGVGYGAPGACCFADTSCTEIYGGDCETLGGQFGGLGSLCASTPCCPPQPGDHDQDGDVDMEDFGWFQTCLSGTDVPAPSLACRCGDFNHDGDVDAGDVTAFLTCLRGPEVPADPNCAD